MSDIPSPEPVQPQPTPTTRRCASCGAGLPPDSNTCKYCGTQSDATSVPVNTVCSKCNYLLAGLPFSALCPECGHPVIQSILYNKGTVPEAQVPTTVPDSALCRSCGYSLVGLQVSDNCPECSRPVSDSIRGDLLKFCDPAYLQSLHRGVVLIEASIIISIVGGIGGIILAAIAGAALGFNPESLIAILSLIPTACSIAGWMLLSIPDPGFNLEDKGDKPRKVLRIAVIVSTVFAMIAAILNAVSPSALSGFAPGGATNTLSGNTVLEAISGAATIGSFIAFIVQYFASMKYLQWIAPRVPNFEIAGKLKKQTWTIALLVFPGCMCFYIGPLVALILFYNLLDKFRIDFKNIRLETTGSAELWKRLVPLDEMRTSAGNPPAQPPNSL